MWSTRAQRPERIDSSRLVRDRGRRYVGAIGASVAARAAGPLLSLAVTPYALSVLGAERFGLFALALTLSGWLTLFDPGLAPGLRIVLARQSSRLDAPAIGPLLGAAALGQPALAVLTLAAGGALAVAAAPALGVPAELREEARTLFLLIAAGTAVSVAARPYGAALDACQWGGAERAVRLAQAVFRAALLALLLAMGMGLQAAGWSYLAACAAGAAGLAAASRRLLPELRWRVASATGAAFRELVRPGAWLSLGAAAGVLIVGVDRAVVARFVSLEAVTVFSLSAAAFLLAEAMLTSAVDAARPALAQALGARRRDEAARLYLRLVQGVAAAAPLTAVAIFTANRAFVTAWAGADSYGGWRLDACFALALVLNLWSLPHRALLSAALQVRKPALLRLAEGVVNLGLSVALAAQYGIVGVAAGTAIAGALTSLWALPVLAARAGGSSVREPALALARGLALSAALAPVALAVRGLAGAGGYLAAGLAAAAVMAAGAALWWRVGLEAEARLFVRTFVAQRRAAWQATA